jgi:hypothetical protein
VHRTRVVFKLTCRNVTGLPINAHAAKCDKKSPYEALVEDLASNLPNIPRRKGSDPKSSIVPLVLIINRNSYFMIPNVVFVGPDCAR